MAFHSSRPISRQTNRFAFALFAVPFLLGGLEACLFSPAEKGNRVRILKTDPAIADDVSGKTSPVAVGLEDGSIVVAWGSRIPRSGAASRTEWKRFDSSGEFKGEGFDWVPYPARVVLVVASASPEEGFALASIVENETGTSSEVYVHGFGASGATLDPASIALPGARTLSEISLLALEPAGMALAANGNDSDFHPTLWVGRFDYQGNPVGSTLMRTAGNGDGVARFESPQVVAAKNGGWVCYWNEYAEDGGAWVANVAFTAEGSPGPLHRRSVMDCSQGPCFGILPLLPYSDGRILVRKHEDPPSTAFLLGPDGDSIGHPDVPVFVNPLNPMVPTNRQGNTYVTLAPNPTAPYTEIQLLDSTFSVAQRRSIPGGITREIAMCATASGKVAIITLQPPYSGTSKYGLTLMDPRWK